MPYNKIENGQANVTVDKLLTIAKELDVTPEELLNEAGGFYNNKIEVNSGQVGSGNILNISYSEEERKLFKELINQLRDEISYLKEVINRFNITSLTK